MILAKTIKGWTLGTGHRVAQRHAPDQEARRAASSRCSATGSSCRSPTPSSTTATRRTGTPGHRLARVRVHDGAAARARRPGARAGRAQEDPHVARRQHRSPTCSRAPATRCRRARPPRSPGCCATCCAIPTSGPRVVPIIPDEARTFGLDALFRDYKIYAPFGQRYEPVDAESAAVVPGGEQRADPRGGDHRGGSMASFTAAGTSYATWGQPMIPFFIFYSMFGFQRVGDLIWSFGDQRGRGFLLGATAGRTTLAGEGLQHCDGQSQLLASAYPNCRAYDPAFAYEMGVIVRDGIERMYGAEPEDCFYYLTLYNENYAMPAMPEGVEDGIVRGLYRFRPATWGSRASGADPGERHRDARGARRAADPARRVRRRRRRVERDELQAAARRRARARSGGTGCTRPSRRARRTSPSSCATAKARSSRSPTS